MSEIYWKPPQMKPHQWHIKKLTIFHLAA
jgi:hypothetical protein